MFEPGICMTFNFPSSFSRAISLGIIFAVIAEVAGCGGGGGGGAAQTQESINGIAVPPNPDSTANQATVGGVDSNGNGIRDDVDRMIATEFGSNPSSYAEAAAYARTQQAALKTPTPSAVDAHIALLKCIKDPQKLTDFEKITLVTVDIPIRRAAYAKAFAGSTLSSKGCQ